MGEEKKREYARIQYPGKPQLKFTRLGELRTRLDERGEERGGAAGDITEVDMKGLEEYSKEYVALAAEAGLNAKFDSESKRLIIFSGIDKAKEKLQEYTSKEYGVNQSD